MPTVFISYSWDSDGHRAWVRRLGEDLRARGITVWLDQFELQLGDDVTQFMERGVTAADHVLLVCTENFGKKAGERRGGVGYEQAIVTGEILHAHPVRGRFVCLLREGAPSSALPTYMRSRLWLDCRDDAAYPAALEQIARHVLGGHGVPGSTASEAAPAPEVTVPPPAAGEPGRWVLVAGTGAARGFTPGLEALSRHLGERLAAARCGLVTGGWPGVDEWVARSFAEAAHRHDAPLEDALVQVVVATDDPPFTAGQLVFVDRGAAEWDEPVRRADAVLLLGGLGGTRETGARALALEKPVLPLPDTGGDAKTVYLEMLKRWSELAWMGIPQKDFQRLARPGRAGVDAAVELVGKLGR